MIDLRATMEKTAEHLAGRVIYLQFRQPPTRGMVGECYKRDSGLTCIDIVPGLDIETMYEIFLHETAHAKLHVNDVNPTPEHLTESGAVMLSNIPDFIQAIASQSEAEAAALVARWEYWVNDLTSEILNQYSIDARIVGKLAALMFYKEN